MTSRSRAKVSGFLTVVIVIAAAPALAQTPEGVSPGAVDRVAGIRTECPTFSWSAVEGVARYEIVVYELAIGADLASGLDLSLDNEVLFTTVAGGATG